MNRLAVLAASVAVSVLLVAPAVASPKKITVRKLAPVSFGLTGYAGAASARSDSAALRAYLSEKLGRTVTTRVFKDYESLASAVAAGEVDVAWMQPLALVAAKRKGAVTPLVKAVRHGLPFYRGVLFTKADQKGEGLKSLEGLRVAWVDAHSAAGYLFPRAALVRAGLKPASFFASESFAGDHDAVCRAVLEGKADVGATFADDRPDGQKMLVDGCVQSVGAEAASGLKIVSTSAPIPNDAIAVRPGLASAEVARLRSVFLGLSGNEDGRSLLGRVFKSEGFVEVGPSDFEPVEFAAQAAKK